MEEIRPIDCPPNDALRDPDPLSVFLIWLGAVGSIASLIGVFDQFKSKREQLWHAHKERTELIEVTTQLEADLTLLEGQIQKMELLLRLASGSSYNGEPMLRPQNLQSVPFRFGAIQLNLPDRELREWYRFHRETCTVASRVGRSVHRLIVTLGQMSWRLKPETYHAFVQLRIELNHVLGAETFGAAVKQCRVAISAGRDAGIRLRTDLAGAQ